MSIKAICFDLDGVYFTPEGKTFFVQKLVQYGADEEKIKYAFFKSPEMNDQYKKGLISTHNFWDFMNDHLGLSSSYDQYEKALVEGYQTDPQASKDVKKARSLGIKTCICSSNFEARVRKLQEKFGFLNDFDFKIFSHQTGFNKPDKQLYSLLVETSHCRPEEIAYADDKQDAIDSAKSVGINAFFVKNYFEYKTILKSLGINL